MFLISSNIVPENRRDIFLNLPKSFSDINDRVVNAISNIRNHSSDYYLNSLIIMGITAFGIMSYFTLKPKSKVKDTDDEIEKDVTTKEINNNHEVALMPTYVLLPSSVANETNNKNIAEYKPSKNECLELFANEQSYLNLKEIFNSKEHRLGKLTANDLGVYEREYKKDSMLNRIANKRNKSALSTGF